MLHNTGKSGVIFLVHRFVLIVEIWLKLFNKVVVVVDSDDVVREQEPDYLNRAEDGESHFVELLG